MSEGTRIVPERANPELLDECLRSAWAASQRLGEPVEIIVVVNGSGPNLYTQLRATYSFVQWVFFQKPLWFGGAIQQGLARARYDWVYLLNDDMVLDCSALSTLSRWRAPQVFAVASQIYFKDTGRRREETGWTNYRLNEGLLEIFDQPPEESETVRGNLYAGGGFRTAFPVRVASTRSGAPPCRIERSWMTEPPRRPRRQSRAHRRT